MLLIQNCWYGQKGLVTRNTRVEFENPISFGSNVISKVKFTHSKRAHRQICTHTHTHIQDQYYLFPKLRLRG